MPASKRSPRRSLAAAFTVQGGGGLAGGLPDWPLDEFFGFSEYSAGLGFAENGTSKADSGKLGSTVGSPAGRSPRLGRPTARRRRRRAGRGPAPWKYTPASFCFLQAYTTPVLKKTRSIFPTCHFNISCGASPTAVQRRWRSTGRGSPGTRCPARTQWPCRCRWWWSRRGAGRPASGGPRPWAGRGAPARTTGVTCGAWRRRRWPCGRRRCRPGRAARRPPRRRSRRGPPGEPAAGGAVS